MMKEFVNKNNLLRLKKLLLTKEVILILAALLITVVFALAHSGGGARPPERQRSVIPSMGGGMGTQENTPPTEPSVPPPGSGAETPLPPEPDIPTESGMEPYTPEVEPELPNTELPPDDIGENPTPVAPPPSADVLPEPELPDTQSETPQVTTPEPPHKASPELPPSAIADDSIIDIAPPQSPTINFRYIWSGSSFKPCADIVWMADSALRINWQLCGTDGSVLLEGEIPASGGAASRLNNFAFDTSAQSQNGLYPKGYTLKLTPHYSIGTDSRELEPHVMELPYFEVTTQKIDGELCPAIATNVGMYFVHSFENLTDTVTGGKLRITGSLLPIEGVQTPLNIDVVSK